MTSAKLPKNDAGDNLETVENQTKKGLGINKTRNSSVASKTNGRDRR